MWRETGPAAQVVAAARLTFVAMAGVTCVVVLVSSVGWWRSDDGALLLYIAKSIVHGAAGVGTMDLLRRGSGATHARRAAHAPSEGVTEVQLRRPHR
jgi:hypothetical protein